MGKIGYLALCLPRVAMSMSVSIVRFRNGHTGRIGIRISTVAFCTTLRLTTNPILCIKTCRTSEPAPLFQANKAPRGGRRFYIS
ncbi:hypothetical protein F5Y16DRAFT_354515 [Xylariaceae sp. FL0255]|nr:hypothetical protein F5Y16DRAFT_354515 [Xylariaceae sp. FL0255]